jgi:hypothetical protein
MKFCTSRASTELEFDFFERMLSEKFLRFWVEEIKLTEFMSEGTLHKMARAWVVALS